MSTASDPHYLSAPIRILDLDLTGATYKMAAGQKLPIVEKVLEPRSGGLCAQVLDALEGRAASIDKASIFAPYNLSLFKGGEQKIDYEDSVAGYKLFIVLDFPSLDETKVTPEFNTLAGAMLLNNYLHLAKMAAEAARFGGHADEVHLIMPNHADARQDQRHGERGPITAAIIARDLAPYFDSVTCLHLHAPQIEGLYSVLDTRLRHISPHEIHGPAFVCRDPDTLQPIAPVDLTLDGVVKLFTRVCVASPDAGGAKMARGFTKYCKKLAAALLSETTDGLSESDILKTIPDIPLVVVDKSRPSANVSEVEHVLGAEYAKGRDCSVFDDMGDGLGTLVKAAEALLDAGANSAEGIISHGYFSEGALPLLKRSRIKQIRVADGMALRPTVLRDPKILVTSIAPALAQVIIDTTTRPDPNVTFAARHTHNAPFRSKAGRFAGPTLDALRHS